MSDDPKPTRSGWKAILAVIAAVQLVGIGLYLLIEHERSPRRRAPLAFERLEEPLAARDLERPSESLAGAELTEGTVLLHVWATWCRPCRKELPLFLDLDGAVAARLVAASVDETWPVIDHYFSGSVPPHVWRLPLGTRNLPVDSLPTTLVVRDGTIVARLTGARDWTADGVSGLLRVAQVD